MERQTSSHGKPPRPRSCQNVGHAKVGITLDLNSHVVPGMQAEAAAKLEAVRFGDAYEATTAVSAWRVGLI